MVPYTNIDLLYGWPAFNDGDGFTGAQSLLNIVESFLNIVCLVLGDHPAAPVVGLVSLTMTASKTYLYFLQGELP